MTSNTSNKPINDDFKIKLKEPETISSTSTKMTSETSNKPTIPDEMPYTFEDIKTCKNQDDNDALVRDWRNLVKFDAMSNPKKFCGNKILYQFQFENLLRCRRNKKLILEEVFADEEKKQKLWRDAVHRNRRDKAPYPSPTDVYEAYRINQGAIVFFKSSTAKYIYKKYNATKVLDPTAGWGGRMLGAMSLGIDYVGYDTNIELKKGYDEMIETINKLFNVECSQKMIYKDCLKADFEEDCGYYDLVLTSPPYVNMENYEHMELWDNDDAFYNGFLIPMLNKSFLHLADNGHMCINISPKMYKHLTEKYGARECDEQVDLRQQMGQNYATKSQDYIYVWSKAKNNKLIKLY